jgi:beta-lactamase regulating signal transducer with metallopeptidase domain
MTLTLLFGMAWKSAVCAGLTLLALRLLRSRSAAERSQAAHLGLLAAVLTPFLSFALPIAAAVELPPAAAAVMAEVSAVSPAAGSLEVADSGASFDWAGVAPWVYGLPAGLLAAALLAGVARLQLLRSRARVVADPAWLTALAHAQQRFGFRHGTALLVSPAVTSPVSWGVLRPVIIVDEASAADAARAEAIIAHELAHLARLDWAKLLLAGFAAALFWFNPLVWILARRCHELREEAADDTVLRGGVAPDAYAELLVSCARAESRGLLSLANAVSPQRGSLAARVRRVLDPARRGAPARLGWTAACCLAAAIFIAPLTVTFVPRTGVTVARAAAATGDETAVLPVAAVAPVAGEANAPQGRPRREAPRRRADRSEERDTDPVLGEALLKVAERGDVGGVERLLEAGVSADARVVGDGSPLIAAARAGQVDVVRRLLRAGANVDMAVEGDGNPLVAAAAAGRLEVVRLLLDSGADIQAWTWRDETALIQASMRGHEDVVRLLIARGADVNARVGLRTPLNVARDPGIERLLREAGARG